MDQRMEAVQTAVRFIEEHTSVKPTIMSPGNRTG